MRFFASLLLAGAALVSANNGTVYVTEVVNEYTTYCPEATNIVYGTNTYTVTEPTTLVISDCPCTVTKPVISITSSVICDGCESATVTAAPVPINSTYVAPAPVSTFTGAANPGMQKSGAGLAAVVAMAAWLL